MGLFHIMSRGAEEDTQRFEEAIYEIKEAAAEVCEIYEQMKGEMSERGGYGERSSYRYGERMNGRGGYGERRGRR